MKYTVSEGLVRQEKDSLIKALDRMQQTFAAKRVEALEEARRKVKALKSSKTAASA